jgi:p-methyltransferase
MGTDCILIGFNELDFDAFANTQKKFSATSAGYSELQTNSVLLGERRLTYMDLLNDVLERRTGAPSHLSAFRMPSLGVAYLASYLLRRGISAEVVNYFNAEKERFAAMLDESPVSVAITTTYYVDDEPIRDIIRFVREHNESVPIIVGGPRVFNVCSGQKPVVRDLLLKSVGAQIYINDSQGEQTLASVVTALRDDPARLDEVANLIYRGSDGSMRRTPRRPENNNLNENAVNWSHFDPSFYAPTTYMRTSRSCSFSCAFCNYPSMAGELALSDLSTIENELRYLVDHGVQNMIFVDDTFNVPLPRFKKICRMIVENKFDLRWVSFFRCSNSDDEAFDLMAEAGCIGAFLGIESGDQRILQNMKKFAKVDRYIYGVDALRQRGILTLASLVLGFPGETGESIRNTIDFINTSRPTFYNVQLYYHDVLAPVERDRAHYGIEGSGYSWRHTTMTWQEAVAHKEDFLRKVDGSALLPLYGLSIWALPYLISEGISLDQATRFAGAATRLLVKGLETDQVEPAGELAALDAALDGKAAGVPGIGATA